MNILEKTDKVNKQLKKRVCFIVTSLQGGGAERMVVNFVNHLNPDKYDLSLICFRPGGEYTAQIRKDISLHDLNANEVELNPIRNCIKIYKLIRLFHRLKPQSVVSVGFYCNFIVILARLFAGRKMKLLIRETSVLKTRLKNKRAGLLKILGFCHLYPLADILIAPSQSIINDFKNVIGSKKLKYFVIPNFIDEQTIQKSLSENSIISPELSSADNKLIIISVGRLIPVKGYLAALKTFGEVQKKVPCKYWILGQGPLKEELTRTTQELGIEDSVQLLGFQNNPYHFLRRSAVFFLPSLHEGFPNALLEAMYIGLPSVITRFHSSVDDIFTHGSDGFIIDDAHNLKAMEVALSRLLMDSALRARMGAQARIHARSFTAKKIVPLLEQLL